MGRDSSKWPTRTEDLAEPEFRDKVAFASIQEGLMTSHIAALRVAKGDAWTGKLLDRLLANGMHIYPSHIEARYAMMRENYKITIVNSSNNATFYLWGHPVGEAWLDQGAGDPGTYIGAHTIAVLKGAKRPDVARQFVDFVLSKEIQEIFARLYGEVPVNPKAETGWVRPLAKIKRIEASQRQVGAIFDDTTDFLIKRGFDLRDTNDAYTSFWRGNRVRDKVPANPLPIF
jgi:ABC-type Fe3+ transport system substrate-binding protein